MQVYCSYWGSVWATCAIKALKRTRVVSADVLATGGGCLAEVLGETTVFHRPDMTNMAMRS